MKQVVGLAVLLILFGAAPASAQETKSLSDTVASTDAVQAPDIAKAPVAGAVSGARPFSKAAIEKAVVRSAATVPQKKPFFKTPWPYVIIGAVVVVVAIALSGSSSSNGIY